MSETIVDEIKNVLNDANLIENVQDYSKDHNIIFNNVYDFSNRYMKRLIFVKQAEEKFIEKHKKEILHIAAKLCRESIGDLRDLITIQELNK